MSDIRNTALIVWRAIEQGIEDPEPGVTLDAETAADPVAHGGRLALHWLRKWHRLALAAGVTPEQLAEIDAKTELVAVAEDSVRRYVESQVSGLLAAGAQERPAAASEVPDVTWQLEGLHDPEEWGRSPAFQQKAWDFLGACEEGTAPPGDDDHFIASWLAGLFGGLYVSYHMTTRGSSREEAQAAYAAMVDGQRAIYGSLAASTEQDAPGTAAS